MPVPGALLKGHLRGRGAASCGPSEGFRGSAGKVKCLTGSGCPRFATALISADLTRPVSAAVNS